MKLGSIPRGYTKTSAVVGAPALRASWEWFDSTWVNGVRIPDGGPKSIGDRRIGDALDSESSSTGFDSLVPCQIPMGLVV